MAGAQPGALGQNRLVRSEGEEMTLPGIVQISVSSGDMLIIETPGGGGFGKANT